MSDQELVARIDDYVARVASGVRYKPGDLSGLMADLRLRLDPDGEIEPFSTPCDLPEPTKELTCSKCGGSLTVYEVTTAAHSIEEVFDQTGEIVVEDDPEPDAKFYLSCLACDIDHCLPAGWEVRRWDAI